jgi:hypothetical protein
VLGRDVLVLEPVGFLLGGGKDVLGRSGDARLRAGGLGEPLQLGVDDLADPVGVGADLLEQRVDDALLLAEQGRENVNRENLGVVPLAGQFLRPDHRLLCLDGVFVESHVE